MKCIFCPLLLLTMMTVSHSVCADADITFHGRLIEATPCVVNGGEMVTVDFGDDVMTTRIGEGLISDKYWASFTFTNDCPNGALVRYQIQGTPASSGNKILAGNRPGLGFTFWNVDYIAINEWFTRDLGGHPFIYVIPARVNGATISGGAINTYATLLAEYQ